MNTVDMDYLATLTLSSMNITDDLGNKAQIAYVTVTPELAEHLLTTNIEHNRKLNDNSIRSITMDLTNGDYLFNGDTIKIDGDGHLCDAQHRLTSIIRSDTTVNTLIVIGITEDAVATLDQNRPRSVSDILTTTRRDFPNLNSASAIQQIISQATPSMTSDLGSRRRLAARVWDNKDELSQWASWAKQLTKESDLIVDDHHPLGRGKQKKAASPAPLGALAFHMVNMGADETSVKLFWKAILTAGAIPLPNADSTVRAVRSYLRKTSPLLREGGTQLPYLLLNYDTMIRQYNYLIDGKSTRLVRARPGGTGTPIRWLNDLTKPSTEPIALTQDIT